MVALLLFAADDPSLWTVHGALTTAMGAVLLLLTSLAGWITAKLNSNVRMQKSIDDLRDREAKCLERVNDLRTKIHEHELRAKDYEHEIQGLIHRIGRLERSLGTDLQPHSGVVVADLKGIIRVFSPSLVPLFKWLPEEVKGRHVSVLIADRFAEKASKAFQLFASDEKRETDSAKIILGDGKTKLGEEFPCSVALEGWQVGQEGLVTATIRERIRDPKKLRESQRVDESHDHVQVPGDAAAHNV